MNSNFLNINKEDTLNILHQLQDPENPFKFYPANNGLTLAGKNLTLGYSCFALKTYMIIGEWKNLDSTFRKEWISYINSFQVSYSYFPKNSFIDHGYLKNFYKSKNKRLIKDVAKTVIKKSKYENKKTESLRHIQSETKQAISSLYQVGSTNEKFYLDFPRKEHDIKTYLDSLDWKYPWQAGAQFASLCVFISSQIDDSNHEKNDLTEYVYKYLDSLINRETGAYFSGIIPNENEVINGAMKVITGLDWINKQIHEPEKLIDFCLGSNLSSEGCDLVDLVYVLYMSTKNTNHRKKEVIDFLEIVLEIISRNKYKNSGYSYYYNKTQMYYYGLKINIGINLPDLHGTLLLNWAIAMIAEVCEFENNTYKTLMP
jgi:hypothetical protein